MNLREAFLADVIEHPDDDAPRLVFADWLDDQGESLRAEFIRGQIRLARMGEDDPEREDVEGRCLSLWAGHRADLAGELAAVIQQQASRYPEYSEFRRGFVERVVFAIDTFLEHAETLFARTPLRELCLEGGNWSMLHRFVECRHLVRLTSLNLRRFPLGADLTSILADCPRLTSLTDLTIGGDEATLEILGGSPILRRLTSLELIGDDLTGEATGRALAFVARSDNLGALERLRLRSGCWDYATSAAEVLANSPRLARLTHLNLYAVFLEDAGAAALAASPYLRGLHHLDLSSTEIGFAGIQALAASPILDSVSQLNLCHNPIGAQGVRALVASPHLGSLSALHLWGCGIGSEGAEALLEFPLPEHFARLDLQADEFSPDQVRPLKEKFGERVWMYQDGKRL